MAQFNPMLVVLHKKMEQRYCFERHSVGTELADERLCV